MAARAAWAARGGLLGCKERGLGQLGCRRVEGGALVLAVGRVPRQVVDEHRDSAARSGGAWGCRRHREKQEVQRLGQAYSFSKYFDRSHAHRLISRNQLPAGDDGQVSEAHRPALEVGLAGLRWLRGGGLAAVASTVAAGGMSRRHCDANTRSWRPRAKVAMSLSG